MAVTAQIGAAIPRVPAMAGQWEAVCTFPGALATPSGGFLVELVLPDGNRTDAAARASLPREAERLKSGAGPRYCIRKGLAGWILIYDWEVTTLSDDKAVYYAAQLLLEPPPTPIHATVLDNLVFGHALVENQRNLGRDDQETLARQGQVRRGCQAILEDETASALEQAEAQRDLDKINDWVRKHQRGTEAGEQKQVRAISAGLLRLIKELERATGRKREPVPVLRAFGRHLRTHLWEASGRSSGRRGRPGRSGCFTYEPPPGVVWIR